MWLRFINLHRSNSIKSIMPSNSPAWLEWLDLQLLMLLWNPIVSYHLYTPYTTNLKLILDNTTSHWYRLQVSYQGLRDDCSKSCSRRTCVRGKWNKRRERDFFRRVLKPPNTTRVRGKSINRVLYCIMCGALLSPRSRVCVVYEVRVFHQTKECLGLFWRYLRYTCDWSKQ